MKNHALNQIVALVITLLFALMSTSLYAVDEDYFIPYTDNYGYEYDPETGTYVKKDVPETVPEQTTHQADTVNTNTAVVAQTENSELNAMNENESSSIKLPVLIASLVGILLLSFVLTKTLRKQARINS